MARAPAFRWLAWLGVIALIAQGLLAPLATAAAARQAGTVVICTGTGFKVISLPDAQRPPASDDGADGQAALDCVACLHGVVGKAEAPAPLVCPQPVAHVLAVALPADQLPAPKPVHHPARSRAPPRL